MKKIINIIGAFFISLNVNAQAPSQHSTCETAKLICKDLGIGIEQTFSSMAACEAALTPVYFKMILSDATSLSLDPHGSNGTYTLYGPFNSFESVCDRTSLSQANQVSGNFSTAYWSLQAGYYLLMLNPTSCSTIGFIPTIKLEAYAIDVMECEESTDCADCISSFSPDPGKYIVSAWVKGEADNKNRSYENPELVVSFLNAPDIFSFHPSGKIIDDWQRIDGIVTIPDDATDILIKLDCKIGTCYFDDIRFVPINGSMISYVYDPINLRLVAQLDERNYATLYEYDEEGKLIRVKKETERGIMTIQENRDNLHKR